MQQNPLQRYTILNELGRGPIGRVYAARDRSRGAVVALKVLDPALFSQPDASLAELFLKNARSAGRLRHRNIVQIFDAGEAGGTVYVAMELVEGESLRQRLDHRPLSIAHAIRIFDDIASALAFAHEEGMVHRGVKPTNILVSRSGAAKITDFGLGQIGESAVRYLSPEQVRGDPVDHRSDLFSLGVVFYEMLARRAPFEGNSAKEIRENILHAEPPLPSAVNPHVPGALDGIVSRMLAEHPNDRFANMRILLGELQRLEEGLGLGPGARAVRDQPAAGVPSRAQPEPPAPQPAAKREPTLQAHASYEHEARLMDRERWPEPSSGSRVATYAALAVMLAVLAIGLGVFLHYSPRNQEAPATAAAPSPSSSALTPVAETIREPVTVGEARGKQDSSAIAPAPSPSPAPPPVTEAIKPSRTGVVSAPPRPAAPTPVAEAIKEAVAAPAAPKAEEKPLAPKPAVAESSPAPQPTSKIPEPQPAGMAKLIVAVSPRGELYIDGKHHGTTPPITTFDLEPGMHRIEIRSGSWKPYLTYMTVQAGDERRIRHDFSANGSRPPR